MTGGERRVASWTWPAVGLALATGVAAWSLRPGPPWLVDAPTCPAAMEGGAVALVRLLPRVPIGEVLAWWSGIALAASVALLVAAAVRAGVPAVAAAAAGLGLAASLPSEWAPPHAATVVVLAIVLAWRAAPGSPPGWREWTAVVGAALGVAAVEPGMLGGAALAAGAVAGRPDGTATVRRRALRGLVTCAVVAAVGLALAQSLAGAVAPPRVSDPAGCGLPGWEAARREAGALMSAIRGLGPFPLGLAAFGLVSAAADSRGLLPAAVVLGLCTAPATTGSVETGAAGAVAAALVWLLASRGLAAVADAAAAPGRRRRMVTWGLAAWVAALPIARAHAPTGEPPRLSRGHETVSLRRFQAITGAMPTGAALVEEDATTAVLARASAPERRLGGKRLTMVPRDTAAWPRGWAASGDVFALPLGWAHLADRGALLEPAATGRAVPSLPALARVRTVRPCAAVDTAWSDVTMVFDGGRVALVAPEPTARGPVLLLLSADEAFDVVAAGWPVRARRGFHLRRFDRQHPREGAALAEEAGAEGFDAAAPALRRHVARLLLFRTPDAPASLAVEVTAPVVWAAAHLQDSPGGVGMSLCPSTKVPDPPDGRRQP